MQITCLSWRLSSLSFIKDPARLKRLRSFCFPTPLLVILPSLCCGLRELTGTLWAVGYHGPCFLLHAISRTLALFQLTRNREEKILLCNRFIFSTCKSMRVFFFVSDRLKENYGASADTGAGNTAADKPGCSHSHSHTHTLTHKHTHTHTHTHTHERPIVN